MEKIRCEECQSYIGHLPTCSLIDFDECKKQLNEYYHAWLDKDDKIRQKAQLRINHINRQLNKTKFSEQLWKGKFNEVKNENNTLRKKIRK
jgi:predicted metal-binding protein